MKKLLTTFLFSLCMTLPAWSATDDRTNDVTYNGLVDFQKKAYSEDAHTDINVYCSQTQSIGKHPNSTNTVSITCPKGEGLIVNHVGYQDQEFTANQLKANDYFFEALLVPSAVAVDDVIVKTCGPNISKGASKQHWDSELQECVPDECYEPAYVLNTTGNTPECEFANANCINSLDNQKGVQSAIWELNEDGESICDIKDCKKPYYDLVEDDKGMGEAYCFDTRETNKNCLDTLSNKTGVKLAEWEDNDEKDDKICKIKSCITPQYELRDGLCADKTGETCEDENDNPGKYGIFKGEFTCVLFECDDFSQSVDEKTNTCKSYIGDKCTPTHNDNVKSAIWEDHSGMPMCVIKECKSKYRPNKAGDKCEPIPKDCSDADKKTVLDTEGVAEAGLDEKEKCVPTDCKCGYNLNNNKCVKWQDEPCDKKPTGATKAKKDCDANGKPYCQIIDCDEDNYTPIKEGTKIIKCDSKRGEDCKSTLSAEQQKIVKVAEYKKDGNTMQCIVKKCINDDYVIEKNMCVYNEGKDCTKEIRHAKAAKWVKVGTELVCQITNGCEDGYKENDDKTKCIAKLKKCTSEDEKKLKDSGHALDTGIKAGTMPEKCVPTECECGYDLRNDQCVALAADRPCDAKNSLPDGAKSGVLACKNKRKEYCQITACNDGYDHDKSKNTCDEQDAKKRCEKAGGTWDASAKKCNGAKCPKGKEWNDKLNKCFDKVIKKRSDEEIKKLEENAQAMKDKEQSTANKMLGGATMAATGIGGMMLAQSLAEQKADQEAEVDMKAYLETFVCKYADGKSFKGGTENIELPGGNDLLPLYTEYVNLANDLKVRKEALGMHPGIESEKILDNATSGLYDDVALGKTGGAYASLARALQDPEGEDAKMWAAQKDKTKKNLIAGASVAGIGAVGGIVGNALINGKNSAKENSDKIKADFKGAAKDITNAAKDITTATPPQRKCSDYNNIFGGTYPNCTCLHADERFFSDNPDGCVACQKGQKYDDKNNCVPDNDDTQNCKLTNNIYKKPNKCECVDNATETKNVCACNTDYHDPNNEGKCIKKDKAIIDAESKSKENKLVSLEFSADVLFDTGKAVLNAKAEAAFKQIAEVIEKHEDIFDNDSNVFEITIFGHADRQPFNSGNSTVLNQNLSEKRAQAVKDVLIKNSPILMKNKDNITVIGRGSAQCTADVYPNANEPKCRKVELTIWAPWATTRDKATGADGFVQTVSNLLKDGNIMNGSNITSAVGGINLQ